MTTENTTNRFSGLARLYGNDGLKKLTNANIVVVGIGGVGSWSAEALARSAVGNITLIDLDDIALSNVNRQIHSLSSTIDESKVAVMKQRILDINPECKVTAIEDFVTTDTLREYINDTYDVVIDAVDSIKAKAAMIAFCKRNKIKIITVGGAGGQIDPLQITCNDLAKTIQDPLAAKLRSELRRFYNFSKNPKRNFGVECVYSTEQLRYPQADGSVCFEKSQQQGAGKMDCATGFGAFVGVTATFGLVAASRAIRHILK
ncbi:tRNA cyclic N6-threonylcarbamoyladenosine(37) synthase TcdA [Glaciecola sp.]|jgi:tRNA A37 threonylcarbamoyladenosine dehydratase|uniref:tRNA cyclic N6-threonylcarbamoyladenosine(37) synthase TcdA n=1 Tax=Glaciecola sp. MF2-115 TaxID=3384827 RepID=UPI003989F207